MDSREIVKCLKNKEISADLLQKGGDFLLEGILFHEDLAYTDFLSCNTHRNFGTSEISAYFEPSEFFSGGVFCM